MPRLADLADLLLQSRPLAQAQWKPHLSHLLDLQALPNQHSLEYLEHPVSQRPLLVLVDQLDLLNLLVPPALSVLLALLDLELSTLDLLDLGYQEFLAFRRFFARDAV